MGSPVTLIGRLLSPAQSRCRPRGVAGTTEPEWIVFALVDVAGVTTEAEISLGFGPCAAVAAGSKARNLAVRSMVRIEANGMRIKHRGRSGSELLLREVTALEPLVPPRRYDEPHQQEETA